MYYKLCAIIGTKFTDNIDQNIRSDTYNNHLHCTIKISVKLILTVNRQSNNVLQSTLHVMH